MNPLNPLYFAVAWVVKQLYAILSPIFGDSSGWTWALTIVLLVALMRLRSEEHTSELQSP